MRTDYSMFEYKNGWYGNILDPVSNKNIIVHISSSDSKQIPDECKEALDWFVENYEAMHDLFLDDDGEDYTSEKLGLCHCSELRRCYELYWFGK